MLAISMGTGEIMCSVYIIVHALIKFHNFEIKLCSQNFLGPVLSTIHVCNIASTV